MANQLKAQQLQTVWISRDDKLDVLAALQKLQDGQGLTAVESGTIAYDPISSFTLIGEPEIVFDGFLWNMLIFVTSA